MNIYNVSLITYTDGSKPIMREQKYEATVGKKTYMILDGKRRIKYEATVGKKTYMILDRKRRISFDAIGVIDTKIYETSPNVQYSMWVLDPDDAHEALISHTESTIRKNLVAWMNKLKSIEWGMDDGFDVQKIDGDARYSLTDEQMKQLNDKIMNDEMF
jgi:hypothetical protein